MAELLYDIVEFYDSEVFSISSSFITFIIFYYIILHWITKHSRRPKPVFFMYSVNTATKALYCCAKLHEMVIELEHNSALKTRPSCRSLSQAEGKYLLWTQII